MAATIANIEAARNETFKAMTFNEIEKAMNAHMSGSGFKDSYSAEDVANLNNDAVIGNQLLIEYALHTNDIRTAAEAAADVFDETLAA